MSLTKFHYRTKVLYFNNINSNLTITKGKGSTPNSRNLVMFAITNMRVFLSYQSILFLFTFLTVSISFAQPLNDNCSDVIELCPGNPVSGSNIGATSENCATCADDFNFCFVPAGSIWYSFTTNNVGGDADIDISSLVVQPNPNAGTEMQGAIISATSICDGSSYTLVSNCVNNATADFSLNATGLTPNTTYYVIIGGDNTSSALPAGATFNIEVTGAGVNPINPTLVISTDSTTVCDNALVNFTANSDCALTASYEWFVNGSLVSTGTDPLFQTTDLQNGDEVSAIIYCGGGCPVTQSSNVIEINVITVDVTAGPDHIITSGQTVQLTGSTSGQVVGWSPSGSLSDPLVENPFATPATTTTYTFSVTDGVCISTDEVTVIVVSEVYPTNTITPNGDDINDFWEISNIERFPDCEISIYDRWGQLVYETRGYTDDKRWDGTKNGKKLNEGVYFYVINLNNGSEKVFRGTITLIR